MFETRRLTNSDASSWEMTWHCVSPCGCRQRGAARAADLDIQGRESLLHLRMSFVLFPKERSCCAELMRWSRVLHPFGLASVTYAGRFSPIEAWLSMTVHHLQSLHHMDSTHLSMYGALYLALPIAHMLYILL